MLEGAKRICAGHIEFAAFVRGERFGQNEHAIEEVDAAESGSRKEWQTGVDIAKQPPDGRS